MFYQVGLTARPGYVTIYFYDHVPLVAAQVVEEHRHVEDDFAMPVAKVMRGTDIVACHLVVVVHLAPVGVLAIGWTVGAAADAAYGRF